MEEYDNLPEWLQELWDLKPDLARKAERSLTKNETIVTYLGKQDKGVRDNRIAENLIQEKYNWNNPEKTFSYKWRTEKAESLPMLLSNSRLGATIEVTDEVRCACATIIQWLGTNIGMEFLRSTLALEGYELKQK